MRTRRILVRLTALSLFSLGGLGVPELTLAEPLTLESAWRLAEQNSPEIKRAIAARESAHGETQDARALLYNNPELNLEGRQRRLFQIEQTDAVRRDWAVGIAQTFEIAGQQSYRREAADVALAALEQEIDQTRRRVRAEVESRFVHVLALQSRIDTERRTLELIEHNTQLANKRVELGEDSQLDGNLAVVDTERARNQLALLQEQLTRARADLAIQLQLPAPELPAVIGELMPRTANDTLDGLLAAVAARPDIRSLELREQSARSRLDQERAARYPDITVNLMRSREEGIEGRDTVTTLGFSLPLPVFRQNAAGIGRAAMELTQFQIDKMTTARDARTSVVAAWQRRESLRERVKRLVEVVYPKMEENFSLSRRAFQDGEIGLPQLLLVQRQTLDAQRDLVEAQLELRLTQIELEYAAGESTEQPNVQ